MVPAILYILRLGRPSELLHLNLVIQFGLLQRADLLWLCTQIESFGLTQLHRTYHISTAAESLSRGLSVFLPTVVSSRDKAKRLADATGGASVHRSHLVQMKSFLVPHCFHEI